MPPAYPEWLDQGQALPIRWFDAMREGDASRLESRLDTLSASDAYLEALYLAGEESVRQLASILLIRRLKVPARSGAVPEARRAPAILRGLAALPVGTSEDRLGLVLLEESIQLNREGRYDESEARLNLILERVPGHRIAMGNLAGIRASQGRPQECRELLRQTVAANPDYLIARCNLAVLSIEDGHLDEAHQLLDGLTQRPRLHIQEVFSLYGALAMLNRARGEHESADALIANLEQLVEDDDDARRLAQAKRRVERANAGGRVISALRTLLKSPPRPYRPKRG